MATRRERVILELQDNFSRETLQAAAAAKTLGKSLDDVDRSSVRATRGIDKTGTSSQSAGREIDRLSGRLRLFADVAVTLGPALVPIGAVAVPAVTALASQFGAAAIAGGTAIAAFQGVGTALEAVNKAALEPTADNLAAARVALAELSPEARKFVQQVQDMRPAFQALRDAAAAGLFPGLSAALDKAAGSFDAIETIMYRVGEASGDLAEDFAEGLAGPRGQEFLAFIAGEVPSALTELGHTVGDLASGMGELWMAFTPVNRDVTGWLRDAAADFDDWAQGLSQTEGFEDFVAYLRENGPRVADALGSLGNAVLQIAEAAAPLGGPALAALTAFADVVAALANSSYGPALIAVASGLALMSRSMKALEAIKASSLLQGIAAGADGASGKLTKLQGAGLAAGIGLSAAVVAGTKLVEMFREDLPGLEQLTSMLMDLRGGDMSALPSEFDSIGESIERLVNPSYWKGQQTSDTVLGFIGLEGRTLTNAKDEIGALEDALINLLQLSGPEASEDAFAKIAEGANLSQTQVEQLRDLMPGYVDALVGVENQSRATGDAAADGFERGKSAAQRFGDAVTRLNNLLEGRAELRDYEAALDDFTKGLKENGRSFDINTEKGRLNQANLDNIAGTLGRVVDGMKRSDRQATLSQARKDIRDLREAGQLSEAQMRFLLAEVNKLDKASARPKVDIDTAGVAGAIAGVNAALNGIQDETVYINVKRGATAGAGLGAGAGFSSGGYTGYGPKDEEAGAVHRREFVFSSEATDGNVAQLRALHDRLKSGAGWSASQPSAPAPVVNVAGPSWSGSVSLSDADVARIAAAVRVGAAEGISGKSRASDRSVRNQVRSGR